MKVELRGEAVSFLEYDGFEEVPFPELRRGVKVYLRHRTSQERAYDPAGNPPILHRKETLLPPSHPRWVEFAALTSDCLLSIRHGASPRALAPVSQASIDGMGWVL